MLTKIIVASSAVLLMASPLANAFSEVNTQKMIGYVASMDASTRTITLVNNNDKSTVVQLSESADIVLSGVRSKNIDALEVGRRVTINKKFYTEIKQDVSGVVLSTNVEQKTVKLRNDKGGKVMVVSMDSATSFVNPAQGDFSFEDLRPGHTVTLRAAQELSSAF